MLKETIGNRVKELRLSKTNLSQGDFAESVGLNRSYLSRVESGKQNITIDKLSIICNAFGMTLNEFFAPFDYKLSVDTTTRKGKSKKSIRVFEGFAGYGGASFALGKVKEKHSKFDYDVVAYSEIDKYASDLFDANHKDKKGNPIKNFPDITEIDTEDKEFPDFDLFTGGFPCQPFSTVGIKFLFHMDHRYLFAFQQ